jgi:hypothetical protein
MNDAKNLMLRIVASALQADSPYEVRGIITSREGFSCVLSGANGDFKFVGDSESTLVRKGDWETDSWNGPSIDIESGDLSSIMEILHMLAEVLQD